MKIKAATLIESVVALTIISIVFAASLITFTSVTQSGNLNQKILAHQFIQAMAAETKTDKKYFEEEISKSDIKFIKTISLINEKGLLKLSIKAVDKNGIQIEQYNEFLISDEKN